MQQRIWFILCFIIICKFLITASTENFYQQSYAPSINKCSLNPRYQCINRKYNYFNEFIETTLAPDDSELHCARLYILDLSSTFMSEKDFNQDVKFFLSESIKSCMNKKIGDVVRIGVFDQIHSDDSHNFTGFLECFDLDGCNNLIKSFTYENIVVDFKNETDLYIDDSNFTDSYSDQISLFLKSMYFCPCSLNSVVLLTNRIVNVTAAPGLNYTNIIDFSCSGITVILLGRNDTYDETLDLLSDSYGLIHDSSNRLANVFNIPYYNCLGNLTNCISPCNTTSCEGSKWENNCPDIITTTTTTTTTTTPPTLPTTTTMPLPTVINNQKEIAYVLAFTNKFSQSDLTIVLDNIIPPLREFDTYLIFGFKIIITSKTSSQWYTSVEEFKEFLDTIKISDTQISADTIDDSDNETVDRLDSAKSQSPILNGVDSPIIVLLTDFFSTKFAEIYEKPNEPLNGYKHFTVYIYNSDAYEHYISINTTLMSFIKAEINQTILPIPPPDGNTAIPKTTTTKPVPKPDDKISETTVLIIIFGAIGGAIAILCTCSFLYRQRMSWKTKLENIRANHHKRDEEGGDLHIDYWELTWDKILVKSEKLGSGAFGQVLRGKIIGKPPCFENFYENLQIRNLSQMENSDVAIKMLPKYADDAAKKEFMNEIELMKLIGYHDNIVNMLGCVTVGHPMCLVLEFCPYRDLLQYVKGRKVEVSISKSLEEKINHTKDFLIFAWQISQGMKYLASKSIIHRDLAARNVLIDADKNAKISDFGLCVQTTDKSINSPTTNNVLISASGRLPIKWLAIESLKNHEFSLKSDIWAFGIVLYEMYSLGEIPFSKIEPKMLLDYLEAGNRPEKPEFCNQETYDIMINCWNPNPPQRPSFEELLTIFTVFLERSTEGYGYLPLLKSETTPNTNEISQKLAQNIVPAAEPPIPKKTVRQRLTSETNKIFRKLKRTNTKNSVFQIEDEEAGDNDDDDDDVDNKMKPLKIQIPALSPGDPPYSAGVEQIRPRFISVRSAESYGSLNDIDAIDPGVEIKNGKPRLKSNLIPSSSTNSSLRKSSTFHLGDTTPSSDNKKPFFQRFL